MVAFTSVSDAMMLSIASGEIKAILVMVNTPFRDLMGQAYGLVPPD